MIWRIAVFSALVLAAVCPARGQSADYRLRWRNGDEFAGQIVSASADRLVWNSAVSPRDVTLELSVLHSISPLSDDNAVTWRIEEIREQLDPPDSAFRLKAQGMTLFGDVKAITPTHVILENELIGEVTVDRRSIDSLSVGRSPRGSETEFIDLVGAQADGWRSIDQRWGYKNPPLQDWEVSEPGRVATRSADARLYLPTELPSSCDIELTVESTRQPRFSLSLGAIRRLLSESGDLRLEAGSDELVISSEAPEQTMTFAPIDRLGIGTRRVSLRVNWDRRTGDVTVFSDKGTRVAEARMALAPENMRGGNPPGEQGDRPDGHSTEGSIPGCRAESTGH